MLTECVNLLAFSIDMLDGSRKLCFPNAARQLKTVVMVEKEIGKPWKSVLQERVHQPKTLGKS